MEENINNISVEELEEVAGGLTAAEKHVEIKGCKHACNVRSTPDSKTDANKIGYAHLGDRYVFYGWTGNWAKIQYGAVKAYVFKDFIKVI